MNDPAAAHAALTAFLRGVERRGVVFAHWQGGDAAAGDAALATTLRGFAGSAPGIPFTEWPRRFWAMLLAAPQLRGTVRHAVDLPPAIDALASGPRAALLLRLVAGLAESEAAAVLGIARPTYRIALQRALPRREDGSPDPAAWRDLSQAAQLAVRAVPAERLETIAMLRDGVRPRPARPRPVPDRPVRPAWLYPATLGVLALTAASLAATWWGPWLPQAGAVGEDGIRVEELPPVPAAGRPDPAAMLASHRDLDLLLAEVTGGFPDDADPAFDAWLVHALAEDGAPPPVPATTTADGDAASREQVDAP